MFSKLFTVLAAAEKKDPRKYQWLEYKGRKVILHATGSDKQEYEVELTKGEKVGIKVYRGSVFLIDGTNLSVQFKLTKADAARVIDNSVGYDGKIGRYRVRPAEGGKDPEVKKRNRVDDKGRIRLTADSSAFQSLMFDPKHEILYVEFKSGATWSYHDVTRREAQGFEKAASQGKWFHRKIKGLKYEEPVEKMPD